ncbi:MAG: hypothetical protein NVS9B8_14950 [Candidatus Limnocylindrales bacterium]
MTTASAVLDRLRHFEVRRPWADPDILANRPFRVLILTTTGIVGVLAFASGFLLFQIVYGNRVGIGVDFHQYLDHVARWQATGQLYLPRQLAGPTTVIDGDPLYPPSILLLLLPFTVIPEPIWWIVPAAVILITLIRLRPAPWTWPILAIIALWPRTPALFLYGNPGMWMVAFICVALRRAWVGPLVLLKPSLAPFALLGFGRRSWFVALAVVVAASIPFGHLWLDYVTVLRNSHVPLMYSLLDLPLTLAPVVAFLGRRREFNGAPRR